MARHSASRSRSAVSRVQMRIQQAAFIALLALACLLVPGQIGAQVTTSQFDNARTGANMNELWLTPQNVNARQFGRLFTLRVDGDVYAQPLYLPQLGIRGKGLHNVLFVATEHDSVYAFDADGQTAAPLWQVSFLNRARGVTAVPDADLNCPLIAPEVGITSTPVIDRTTGTLYVLARTREPGSAGHPKYVQRLHALDVISGAEKFGGPVEIRASVSSPLGPVDFDAHRQNQRSGLLLANGNVYIAWASSCDCGRYHGWVMAYGAQSLRQVAVFNTSPDDQQGGIWQSDTGIAADNAGNVFINVGNGKFDAGAGGRDYGDSVVELNLSARGLSAVDYFTPYNQKHLNDIDLDLGSGGVLLLPDQPGAHPHLLVTAGKEGVVYMIDRDKMGRFHEGSDSHAVQTLPASAGGLFAAPAYWNQHVYVTFSEDVLKDFLVQNGRLSAQPAARGKTKFPYPGATPAVSADGFANGIVWIAASHGWQLKDVPSVLHAYDAMNVAHELYSSEQNSARDRASAAVRFTIPTVINGRVYAGGRRAVDVYGLLPPSTKYKKSGRK